MPVPTLLTDLSATIASNSPAGSDNVFPDLDNYLRALSGFLASIRDNTGNGWVSPYLPLTYTAGTANGIPYLNASKVVTTGTALTFSGTNLATTGTASATKLIPTGGTVAGNGMYLSTTNTVALSTAGVQAVTVDASQNLLVGLTSSSGWRTSFKSPASGSGCSVFTVPSVNLYPVACVNEATAGDNNFLWFLTEAAGSAVRGGVDYNRAGGLTRYLTTSDYRAKTIVGPVLDSGSTIDALQIYEGLMHGATQSRPMLIAHEAQAVTPYAVTGTKDAVNEDGTPKLQQIDTSTFVPLLIAEIQSLRARVAALEA